ncbi:MAG: methyltransferase, partial [Planctomycetota bacterium]|nr:methyltransferase [Planctomycetota bacterium]
VFGMPIFDHLEKSEVASETFNQAMGQLGRTMYNDAAIIDAMDFSSMECVMDAGGGHGNFLMNILQANPHLKGILFDLPHVIEGARPRVQQANLEDRCELVAGSFFEALPKGADACILKRIIHDWDDESSIAILKNCREAMGANGRVLIVETVIPKGNEPFFGKLLDLHMMIITGGLERTEEEYRSLLGRAGLALSRVLETECCISVVEGIEGNF